jgi:enamine deaminase RidA (YjgF/YER057c/UK114 family)
MSAEGRLGDLELPPPPVPLGVYKPILVHGRTAYLSGHGPILPDGRFIEGRVGADLDLEAGRAAARQVGLAMLATLRARLGSLDRVVRVVKLLGWVNCTDDFREQPAVINGCSELFRDLWGVEHGVGARSAIGTNTLPGGIPVEIEGIFEIAPD